MTEFEMVDAISVDAYPVAAAAMTEAGQGWFGPDLAGKAARLAVAAWAAAVNGDDALLARGHVSPLDEYLGYTFASRFETAEECRRRTGTSAGDGVLVPSGTYLLHWGFFDHDIKWGSSAELEVSSDPAPTREEAEKLIWPAIWAQTARSPGKGDWQPSLSSLSMTRLLEPPPTGDVGRPQGRLVEFSRCGRRVTSPP
jgi:hypothetical protein